ncbi:hypothetical protein HFD88_008296 [Aspergillus terreus]|nr:hypothetical protein HFD88_008296 [Aspergillus terreus]
MLISGQPRNVMHTGRASLDEGGSDTHRKGVRPVYLEIFIPALQHFQSFAFQIPAATLRASAADLGAVMSADQIARAGVPGDFEHPNESLRRSIIVALYFAFILSTAAVGVRLLARRLNGTGLFLDDYLILVALLFKYGCSIGVVILLFNGLGSHITMIPKENLEVYFKIGWSNSFVYTSCVAFIKLSILALYKRLFSTKRMVIAVNVVSGIIILWMLAIWIVGALQCIPVRKFWDRSVEGACMDPVPFYYGMQIPNIITDLIVLAMPMKTVWALPISTNQRLLLSGVFIVGGLSWVFDIVRLVEMIKLTKAGPDITYNQIPMVVWTCIQAATGITAACLAHLRPLFNVAQRRFKDRLHRQETAQSSKELLDKGFSSESTNYELYHTQHSNV